jgi:predicted branched-subunit amino acid permease
MAFDLTNPFSRRPRRIAGLPRVVRLYIASCLIGFALAAVFAGLLIGINVGNLRHLIATVEGGGLAAFLLFFFNGIVFSGVQFGITVMSMDHPRPAKPQCAKRVTVPLPVTSDTD